ncbi:MAG: hypothetical protein KJ571_17030 [Bacteroidetes bacterium]|nr:hypothetical protein [Bacteroidota bacterium]
MLLTKKIINSLFFLFIFFSFFISTISAQERNLIKFSVENGLSLSQISCIDQSKDGFLIVGTYGGGFSLFDGITFRNFNSSDGLGNNVVYDINVDLENNIWLGTSKGLSRFDGNTFVNYQIQDGLPNEWIWKLLRDKNNNLWIATNKGICKYSNNTFTRYEDSELNDESVYSILESKSGAILMGTQNGLISYNGKNFELVSDHPLLQNNRIYSIYEDKNNSLWLGTEKGLMQISNQNVLHYSIPGLSNNNTIWSIKENFYGNLLIGTDEGIKLFDFLNFSDYTNSTIGISNRKIWTIFKDRESNLWFGSDDGLYLQNSDIFKRYNNKGNIIFGWSFIEIDSNNLWIGTGADGILSFKNGKFNKVNTGGILKSNSITYFYKDVNNDIWVANDSGIIKYDGKTFSNINEKLKLKKNIVMSLLNDQTRDCLWIATYYDGIYCYKDNLLTHYTEVNGLSNNMVYDLLIDNNGDLWAGTDHGISKFEDNKFITPQGLEKFEKFAIMKMLKDKKNNIWLGTYELGLIKIGQSENGQYNEFDTVNVKNNLNDNSVLSMSFDKNENIWIGTNFGINKFDLNKYFESGEKNVISFAKGDGFPGVETVQGGIYSDSKGQMWFGTIGGIIKFNPDEIKLNKTPPYVNITKVESFNNNFERNTTYSNILHEIYYSDFNNIPYENNNLTIHFTGICFANSQKVKYKYRLNKGEWSPAFGNQSVSFSNMNPGSYTFEVIASNNHGIWNQAPAIIKFKIISPYYNTWWFYTLSAAIVILLIYYFIKIRFKKIEKKNKELRERIKERLKYEEKLKQSEQELIKARDKAEKSDRLKSEFLAQMSHEIRTPVNSILSFTTLLRNEFENVVDEDLKDSFTIIESGGRRLIRTIDSILNMSQLQVGNFETRKEKIDLVKIVENLFSEFNNTALQKKLDFKIIKNGESFIETRDEYTVTQLIANLIDNSLKYTLRGYVYINIFKNESNNTVIEVKDSGIGISKEFQEYLFTAFTQEDTGYTRKFEGSGLGLALVKKYAELNNIIIEVQSEKEKGTTFSIEFLPK